MRIQFRPVDNRKSNKTLVNIYLKLYKIKNTTVTTQELLRNLWFQSAHFQMSFCCLFNMAALVATAALTAVACSGCSAGFKRATCSWCRLTMSRHTAWWARMLHFWNTAWRALMNLDLVLNLWKRHWRWWWAVLLWQWHLLRTLLLYWHLDWHLLMALLLYWYLHTASLLLLWDWHTTWWTLLVFSFWSDWTHFVWLLEMNLNL